MFFIFWWPLRTVGPRPGPTKCLAWSGSKLFYILMVSMKEYFENVPFEKMNRRQKAFKISPHAKRCIWKMVLSDMWSPKDEEILVCMVRKMAIWRPGLLWVMCQSSIVLSHYMITALHTVNVLKNSNTSCLPKRPRQTVCRPRSDCFSRSSLIRVFPVCYSDKHFVNFSPGNQHFIWNQSVSSV